MDILFLNNYTKKYASDEEGARALKYINAFIKERNENNNYDYYIIAINTIVNDDYSTIEPYSLRGTKDSEMNNIIMENIFKKPVQNKSICHRMLDNPFEISNPNLNNIFNSIIEGSDGIRDFYILSPSTVKHINLDSSIKNSKYFDKEKNRVVIVGV